MTASVIGALRINLGLNSAEFERGMDRASSRARRTGLDIDGAMRGVAAAGLAALGVAAVKLGSDLARLGAEFDDSMRRLGAAADISAESLGAVADQMRQIGLATGVGAAGAANVAKELMKAGVTMQDATSGATQAVIRMAQANEAELAESVDVAAQAMLLFGKRGDQMNEVAQAATAYVSGTRMAVLDYAGALGMGGQAAASAGISLEEFTGALVASANAFSSGSDQGTAFKTFIQRLTPTSDEAAAAMAEMGFSAYDATGKMKPLQQIVDELSVGISRYGSDLDRNRVLLAIFGTDAIRMAQALTMNAEKMREVTNETIKNTDHNAKAEMANSGFAGSLKDLSAAFQELGITLGELGLTKGMIAFVDFLTYSVTALARVDDTIWRLIEGHRALANQVGKSIGLGDNAFGLPTVNMSKSLPAFGSSRAGAPAAGRPAGAASGGRASGGGGSGPSFNVPDPAAYFGDYLNPATATFDETMRSVSDTIADVSGMTADWERSIEGSTELTTAFLEPTWQELADHTADALNNVSGMLGSIKRGDWLGALAQGIQLISRISDMSKAGGFGGGFGGVMKGIGKLMGFANGGSFEVAGASGVDRNLVAFRATAGERVTVTKPGQSAGGGSMIYAPQIDARGADAGAVARIEAALKADAETRRQQFVAMYRDARARGKI